MTDRHNEEQIEDTLKKRRKNKTAYYRAYKERIQELRRRTTGEDMEEPPNGRKFKPDKPLFDDPLDEEEFD